MKVTVNGEPVELSDGTTVEALVTELGTPERGVAVAVDARVVPRSEWGTTPVPDGGAVEILSAAQGG